MESPKLNKLIAQHTQDLICLHDEENTIRFATPSSANVLGFTPQALTGKRLTDFLSESFINEMDFTTLMRFFNQPGARIRYQVRHGDNRLRWLESTFTPIEEPEYNEYHFLSTTRDITESVHLTDDLMQALSTEQELSKLKTNLYSVASHEFKTPLAVIQANIEMLKVKQSPELLEKGLDAMEEEVDHLIEMIGDMLELKKLTSGRRNFNTESIDVARVVEDVIKQQKDKNQGELDIQMHKEGEPCEVKLDYSLIRFVISNLMGNAVKFSEKGQPIEVLVAYRDKKVEVSIKDHGIGIPKDEQASIFQSFYRAKNVGSISGTGVGLAIASEFVNLHNGKMEVESEEGKGSEFKVVLPK